MLSIDLTNISMFVIHQQKRKKISDTTLINSIHPILNRSIRTQRIYSFVCLYFSQKHGKSVTSKSVVLIPPILWQTNFLSVDALSQVYFIAHAELEPLARLLLTPFS